ncbi:MAG TPA: tetratricopeptide repeat protein [Pyrinomonadaceae bacterium]|nr:tetratricopeptide repeat protein [Pyrinomonadaceae bacterium]
MSEDHPNTPYEIYESIITALPAGLDRIELVRRDQELIQDGWTLHYAVDPHDIGRFCIPINLDEMVKELKPGTVQEISRQQNGRYEVFYNVNRPILLRGYDDELERSRKWLRSIAHVVNDDVILDKYLEILELSPRSKHAQTKEIIEELTDRDIGSIIAIVTGILHIGAKRLNEISHQRLLKGRPEGVEEPPRFERRKDVTDALKATLRKYFTEHAGQFEGAQTDLVQALQEQIIEDRISTDSEALDELLWLNSRYNPAKHLILYFSSTPKALYIDKNVSGLRNFLPKIDGAPYPLVRTPDDLFVFMLYKGDSHDQKEQAQTAAKTLNELGGLLTDIAETRDAFKEVNELCRHCNIDVREPLCNYGTKCEGIREYGEAIRERQYRNVNMSLQLRLAEVLEKTVNQSNRKSYQQQILDAIKEVICDLDVKPEQRRMNFLMNVSITKANFVSKVVGPNQSEQNVKVSCYLNVFPTVLEFGNPELQRIFREVMAWFATGNKEGFEDFLGGYLKFDANLERNPGSELMRSFLYLVMGNPLDASAIARQFLDDNQTSEPLRREFHYLLPFCLWKENKHEEALRYTAEGCKLYPGDGRFYHCRSVILLDLLTLKEKETTVQQQSEEYGTVLHDTLLALERLPAEQTLMRAVCHNNVAYYLSDPQFGLLDSDRAQQHFQKLARFLPEAKWDPVYPEFFHTKGCVFYAKFLESPAENQKLLADARAAAFKAVDLYPRKAEHDDLLKRIESALKMKFNSGSALE